MPRVRPTQDIRPLADFRANLAAVVRQVQETKRPVILTQHGRSAAVLVDAGEYEALLDRAALLEDIRVAEMEVAAAKGVPHSKARAVVQPIAFASSQRLDEWCPSSIAPTSGN